MNNETPNPSARPARLVAEPLTNAALIQSILILGALGIAAYKVLEAALRLI